MPGSLPGPTAGPPRGSGISRGMAELAAGALIAGYRIEAVAGRGGMGVVYCALQLSVDAVKAHLRVLFEKLGVEHLPQNQKRVRLIERAFHNGVITGRDLLAP